MVQAWPSDAHYQFFLFLIPAIKGDIVPFSAPKSHPKLHTRKVCWLPSTLHWVIKSIWCFNQSGDLMRARWKSYKMVILADTNQLWWDLSTIVLILGGLFLEVLNQKTQIRVSNPDFCTSEGKTNQPGQVIRQDVSLTPFLTRKTT